VSGARGQGPGARGFERSVGAAVAAFAIAIWGAARWDLGTTNRWYGEWRFAHAFSAGEIVVDVVLIAVMMTAAYFVIEKGETR
jgi:hypothetical protein